MCVCVERQSGTISKEDTWRFKKTSEKHSYRCMTSCVPIVTHKVYRTRKEYTMAKIANAIVILHHQSTGEVGDSPTRRTPQDSRTSKRMRPRHKFLDWHKTTSRLFLPKLYSNYLLEIHRKGRQSLRNNHNNTSPLRIPHTGHRFHIGDHLDRIETSLP